MPRYKTKFAVRAYLDVLWEGSSEEGRQALLDLVGNLDSWHDDCIGVYAEADEQGELKKIARNDAARVAAGAVQGWLEEKLAAQLT